MDKPSISHRPGLAVGLKLLAIFLFIAMAAMIKAAVETVPPGQAVFFRSLLAMPVIVFWIWQRGELQEALVTKHPWAHVWRGFIGTSSMALTFAGLGLLPLPEVTAIGYATPIFTVILAVVILHERVGIYRISAVALGLIGVMIVVWPRLSLGAGSLGQAAGWGAVMVLVASLLRALVQIHVRTMVKTEHTAAIVFYFSLTAVCLSLTTMPFGWVVPDTQALVLMCSAGLIGGLAQILVTSAYRFSGASMLAPFDYSSLIFAALIGYVIFGEVPTFVVILGASLVIAGGAIIMWRERQLGLERGKARPFADPKG